MNIRPIINRLFPRQCLLCASALDTVIDDALCPGCKQDLPWASAEHCPVCALPTPGGEVCGHCLKTPPAFARTQALFNYRFPVDRLIQQLKYQEKLSIAPILGTWMAARWQGQQPDIWLPMPLHINRLTTRGFNQAVEITRALAHVSQRPMQTNWASRERDTPSQAGLKRAARRKNLHGAFVCTPDVAGLHIGIVDDVMTTGSTLNALAEVLLRAGAREISCAVTARA